MAKVSYALFYPALCLSQDGNYFITNHLYSSDESAREDIGDCFVQLLRDYPPLKLAQRGKL